MSGSYPGRVVKHQTQAVREAERAMLPRVSRDPCQRCGVRGDVGCDCPKQRIGTVWG